MCKKRNSRKTELFGSRGLYKKTRIDSCMSNLVSLLNSYGLKTLGCCGHGKYDMSIVYQLINGKARELISGAYIERRRKFYKKDKQGYYYIPEASKK